MSFEVVENKLREALDTGAPHEKLRALELANELDDTLEQRVLGKAVISLCIDAYAESKHAHRIRNPYEHSHGKGAHFTNYRAKRVFSAVSLALGTSYGVDMIKPVTPKEYREAASIVISRRYRTRQDTYGPYELHVLSPADLAVMARGHNEWLMVSDFSVPGTAYMRDVMMALDTKTPSIALEDL